MNGWFHTATIRRFASTGTDSGGQDIGAWSDYKTIPGRLYSTGGKEIYFNAQAVIAEYAFEFGTDAGLTEKDRLVCNGETFEVLLVEPVNGPFGVKKNRASLRVFK